MAVDVLNTAFNKDKTRLESHVVLDCYGSLSESGHARWSGQAELGLRAWRIVPSEPTTF